MTETIEKQIIVIQSMKDIDMFNVKLVQRIARRRGFTELMEYLENNKGEYARFILTGYV